MKDLPKTEEDFLQYTMNVFPIESTVDKYIKYSKELKERLHRQYLLNESLAISENEKGYTSLTLNFQGVSNEIGVSKIILKDHEHIAQNILESISLENRTRIVVLKELLNIK